MSAAHSVSTHKRYGVQRVCRVWGVARSTHYARVERLGNDAPAEGAKRGPKTVLTDAELLRRIRAILERVERDHGIRGEGHRKVRARLMHEGSTVGKGRVLRIMRENSLLAPTRVGRPRGPRTHDGTIITELPNEMWGTDATRIRTTEDGMVWVFAAVDHCVGDCVGIHASIVGNRFEALQPVYQGVTEHFGAVDAGRAAGLKLRHDHGSQYTSRHFQREIAFLGIESSPSYVRSPEGNGVAERFIRTLKEQLLWVETFATVDELREALQAFRRRFNERWLLGRHGYATPDQVRARLTTRDDPEKAAA